jgi:hypothetical protein
MTHGDIASNFTMDLGERRPQPGDVVRTAEDLPLHGEVEVVRLGSRGGVLTTLVRGEVASIGIGKFGNETAITRREEDPRTGVIRCGNVFMTFGEMGIGAEGNIQTRLVTPSQ